MSSRRLSICPERLCEKRPFAFKQSKEKCLYRPKETTFHTASDTNLRSKVQSCTHADARSAATARQVEIAHVNATWYQRLCEKRPFAFKQSKEKWLYRPKETTLHTASQ